MTSVRRVRGAGAVGRAGTPGADRPVPDRARPTERIRSTSDGDGRSHRCVPDRVRLASSIRSTSAVAAGGRDRAGARTGVRHAARRRPRADHASVTQAFRFRLEPVRALSERRETEAQSALAAALADESAARARLADAEQESRAAVLGLGSCMRGGSVTGAQLRAQEAWIGRTAGRCESLALDVDRRTTESDARRGVLTEAARDHEVLERLRLKRAAEHRAEQARQEQEALDEIALGLHRRRSA